MSSFSFVICSSCIFSIYIFFSSYTDIDTLFGVSDSTKLGEWVSWILMPFAARVFVLRASATTFARLSFPLHVYVCGSQCMCWMYVFAALGMSVVTITTITLAITIATTYTNNNKWLPNWPTRRSIATTFSLAIHLERLMSHWSIGLALLAALKRVTLGQHMSQNCRYQNALLREGGRWR